MESSLFSSIQLPGFNIPGNIFLAPLAGYTDQAFREICRIYGASFTYTEMVSAEAIARGSKKTMKLMERASGEEKLGIQLFLSEPDQIIRALPGLLRFNPSLIDINCGCPVPKVIKNGAGAALMRDPKQIGAIVKALTERTDIPVTVKIRSGWNASELTYLEAAESAVKSGASMIAIHARTRVQGYSGQAEWKHIENLSGAVPVPVIGSGDLFSPKDAHDMLTQTRCSGVMFARGAIGNPSIFRDTRRMLDQGSSESAGMPKDSAFQKLKIGLQHLELCTSYKGERLACREMKKHLSAYTKGLPESSALRNNLMRCTSTGEYRSVLDEYLVKYPEGID